MIERMSLLTSMEDFFFVGFAQYVTFIIYKGEQCPQMSDMQKDRH